MPPHPFGRENPDPELWKAEGSIPKFHKGGIVPNYNVDSKGEVLAKLLPGEMVVPREEVKALTLSQKATKLGISPPLVPNFYTEEEIKAQWKPELDAKGKTVGGQFGGIGTMPDDTILKRPWKDIDGRIVQGAGAMSSVKDFEQLKEAAIALPELQFLEPDPKGKHSYADVHLTGTMASENLRPTHKTFSDAKESLFAEHDPRTPKELEADRIRINSELHYAEAVKNSLENAAFKRAAEADGVGSKAWKDWQHKLTIEDLNSTLKGKFKDAEAKGIATRTHEKLGHDFDLHDENIMLSNKGSKDMAAKIEDLFQNNGGYVRAMYSTPIKTV